MSVENAPSEDGSRTIENDVPGELADASQVSQESDQQQNRDGESPVESGSRFAWMVRGMVVAAMLVGSANAISYFFRSRGWGGLLGRLDLHDEAIGFPLTIWRENGGYGGHALQPLAFIIMIGSSLALGVILGAFAISYRRHLDDVMSSMASGGNRPWRTNYSLKTLMMMTVLTALAAAAMVNPRIEILAGIYVLGPALLICVAFLPKNIKWQQRVAFLIPMTLLTIAVAIAVGYQLRVEFDKVLLGIFICWTPQAALGAIGLSTWIFYWEIKQKSLPA